MLFLLSSYLRNLAQKRANSQATSEFSLRDELSIVLNATAAQLGKNVVFVGEGKKTPTGKRPDYTITRADLPIGYIEAEKVDADLSDLKDHARYQSGFRLERDPL